MRRSDVGTGSLTVRVEIQQKKRPEGGSRGRRADEIYATKREEIKAERRRAPRVGECLRCGGINGKIWGGGKKKKKEEMGIDLPTQESDGSIVCVYTCRCIQNIGHADPTFVSYHFHAESRPKIN